MNSLNGKSDPSGDFCPKVKGIILMGGPGKGAHFRPLLSLDLSTPLFPLAGYPIIHHHIETLSRVNGMFEIILIGFYQLNEQISQIIYQAKQEFKIQIRYLQEFAPLGTAGGLNHFRDQITAGNPELLFVIHSDVCGAFNLNDMLKFHLNLVARDHFTMMTTEATRQQSLEYGCVVYDEHTNEVLHYVEKPSTFVSTTINCGVYLLSPSIFKCLRAAFVQHQDSTYSFDINQQCDESICLEKEVFQPLAGDGKLFMYPFSDFWSQIKSTSALIYSNRHILQLYHQTHPERLFKSAVGQSTNPDKPAESPNIIGDVYIHPSSNIHPSATIGPNVSIGPYCQIGEGVRIRESIILESVTIRDNACIINTVIGWNVIIGQWARVEGSPNDPNPNKPFAKMDHIPLFNDKGKLNPSITLIGSFSEVPSEIVVLNSVVLPHKQLIESIRHEIIL